MQTMSISAAKARLNDLVDEAARTHEYITITKNGSPAAVLLSADEWESLQETLFWLSDPKARKDIAEGRRELAEGQTLSEEQVRARYTSAKRA